ncbi:MAG: efflux RND transporter periplasmic adaptor subunit [Flavobacteriales bacterium]
MKIHRIIITALFFTGVLFIVFRLGTGKKTSIEILHSDKKEVKYLRVKELNPDSVKIIVKGEGRVNAAYNLSLSSQVQGRLIKGDVPLRKGTKIKAGQLVFRIDNTEALYLLRARKSAYITILANALADLKLDFPKNYDVWKVFFDKLDATQPLPELPNAMSPEEKTFLAARNILTEYYSIRSDEERMTKYNITAPFDGTISEVFAQENTNINPGAPVASLLKTGELEIEVPLMEKNARFVEIGMPVKLTNNTGKTWTGKVVRKSDYINITTQSIPVFVAINKRADEANLFDGNYLTVEIKAGIVDNAIELPRKVVYKNNLVYFVSKSDSLLISKEVNVVAYNDEKAVVQGLKKGEWAVVDQLIEVPDSLKVIPIFEK